MSNVRATYHVVFGTKERRQTITPEYRRELYSYIYGILKNNGCFVYRINGMAEHLHILFDLNPMVALADLVKSIKQGSSKWLKANPKFPFFYGWCRGYYAYTLGSKDIEAAIQYIINQEAHHNTYGYLQEIQGIAQTEGWQWYDDLLY